MKRISALLFLSLAVLLLGPVCQPINLNYPAAEMRGAKVGAVYFLYNLEESIVTVSNSSDDAVGLKIYRVECGSTITHIDDRTIGGHQDDKWRSDIWVVHKYDHYLIVSTSYPYSRQETTHVVLDDKLSFVSDVWEWKYKSLCEDFTLWFDLRDGINVIWAHAQRQEHARIKILDECYTELCQFGLSCYESKALRLRVPIPRELRIQIWERVTDENGHLTWDWRNRGWIRLE